METANIPRSAMNPPEPRPDPPPPSSPAAPPKGPNATTPKMPRAEAEKLIRDLQLQMDLERIRRQAEENDRGPVTRHARWIALIVVLGVGLLAVVWLLWKAQKVRNDPNYRELRAGQPTPTPLVAPTPPPR